MAIEDSTRVEVHRILEFQTEIAVSLDAEPTVEETSILRPFSIERHWVRGGFQPSLYASTEVESYDWRGEYLRLGLPTVLGVDSDNAAIVNRVWRELARQNGWQEEGVRRKLQLRKQDFRIMMDNFEQQGTLYRLPFWTAPGDVADSRSLYYFTDTGIHHRILDIRAEVDMKEPILGKSWEGFVIRGLSCAAGTRAICNVWEDESGEIDLIIRWEAGSTWAIEITKSARKVLKEGFHRGRDVTAANRSIVIQGLSNDGADKDGIERMTFGQALRAVSIGP